MKFTVEDIKNMSDEEVAELNRKLAGKVLKRIALITLSKWALIFGTTYLIRRTLEEKTEKN